MSKKLNSVLETAIAIGVLLGTQTFAFAAFGLL